MDPRSPPLQVAAAPTLKKITETFEPALRASVAVPCIAPTADVNEQHSIQTRIFNIETATLETLNDSGQWHFFPMETSVTLSDLQQRIIKVILSSS